MIHLVGCRYTFPGNDSTTSTAGLGELTAHVGIPPHRQAVNVSGISSRDPHKQNRQGTLTLRELQFHAGDDDTAPPVSALLLEPSNPQLLAVLAHGAGAGMRHSFMQSVADSLAARGIASLRFNFPYMESTSARPDSPTVAEQTVRAAVRAASSALPKLPIIAGGKSFGGRMTSSAAANEPLDGVRGLFFLGFPLHPPKRPDVKRAEHLSRIRIPMLFLQGTRDDLADLVLLEPLTRKLEAHATLHIVEGADHSFSVLKRTERTNSQVLEELTSTIVSWATALPSG